MLQKDIIISSFKGIDNTSDPRRTKVAKDGFYFRELENVDIDDEGIAHRRDGFGSVKVSATGIHSIWSNGDICLFLQGSNFKKLDKDFSTTTTLVEQMDATDRLSYVQVGDKVYWSNNSCVGYVDLTDELSYAFPDPDQTFKTRMVGGHILEYFNSRLYAAQDRIIYFSDATVLTRMDYRKNGIPFTKTITMMKAVKDGIYVGTLDGVTFLSGLDPADFTSTKVTDQMPFDGMSISVDGDDIGKDALGRTVYWLAKDGIYKGYPGGVVIQMQEGLYCPDDFTYGTAIYMNRNGYGQYLGIGRL